VHSTYSFRSFSFSVDDLSFSVIHNDFERGFIRAETVSYSDLVECGSELEAKSRGLLRSEGKDYVVKPDDVILFRFNV